LLEKVVLTLPRGKHDNVVTTVEVNAEIVAPLAKGDRVGTVTLSLDGETKLQVPAVALEPVEEAGFFARLWDSILMLIASLFGA
jgi:serine-type D-Ala-D-Ala carboxypeptidase (penicillin-binding protein 5/6)